MPVNSTLIRHELIISIKDNPVNMMLLSMYMRKNDWDFEKGENGLLALHIFESRPQGFDVIFMGKNSPCSFPHFYAETCLLTTLKKIFPCP